MRKELITVVAGAVAVFVLIWLVATRTHEEALPHVVITFVGILVEVVLILAWASYRTNRAIWELKNDQGSLLSLLQDRVARSERLTTVLRYYGHDFTTTEMQQIWLQMLNEMQSNYLATNYIDTRKIYDTDWG